MYTSHLLLNLPFSYRADTFQCWRQRFGGAEVVRFGKQSFACLAHGLDPKTVPARFAQSLQLKSVTRTSVNHDEPNKDKKY